MTEGKTERGIQKCQQASNVILSYIIIFNCFKLTSFENTIFHNWFNPLQIVLAAFIARLIVYQLVYISLQASLICY